MIEKNGKYRWKRERWKDWSGHIYLFQKRRIEQLSILVPVPGILLLWFCKQIIMSNALLITSTFTHSKRWSTLPACPGMRTNHLPFQKGRNSWWCLQRIPSLLGMWPLSKLAGFTSKAEIFPCCWHSLVHLWDLIYPAQMPPIQLAGVCSAGCIPQALLSIFNSCVIVDCWVDCHESLAHFRGSVVAEWNVGWLASFSSF